MLWLCVLMADERSLAFWKLASFVSSEVVVGTAIFIVVFLSAFALKVPMLVPFFSTVSIPAPTLGMFVSPVIASPAYDGLFSSLLKSVVDT